MKCRHDSSTLQRMSMEILRYEDHQIHDAITTHDVAAAFEEIAQLRCKVAEDDRTANASAHVVVRLRDLLRSRGLVKDFHRSMRGESFPVYVRGLLWHLLEDLEKTPSAPTVTP